MSAFEASDSDDDDMACIGLVLPFLLHLISFRFFHITNISNPNILFFSFMFDTAHHKDIETFSFSSITSSSSDTTTAATMHEDFHVDLTMIKGEPGHVQSGQYLWPAARFAVDWMASHAQALLLLQSDDSLLETSLPNNAVKSSSSSQGAPPLLSIVELGAGCGLTGLGVCQICPQRVHSVVLTDRDYGSLQLLDENATRLLNRRGADTWASCKEASSSPTTPTPTVFSTEKLDWGAPIPATLRNRCLSMQSVPVAVDVDVQLQGKLRHVQLLLVGSDLLYCRDVVQPLLQTIFALLCIHRGDKDVDKGNDHKTEKQIFACPLTAVGSKSGSIFVLTSSFDVGLDVNEEVALQLALLHLEMEEVNPLNVSEGQCRVQYFRLA